MSDGGLGERARLGEADAFGALVAREQHAARRVATVVLGTAEGADDIVQQATERAWRAIPSYQPDRPFGPWFFRIVANCARNDRRARGRRAELAVRASGPELPVVTPEDAVIADEDRRLVIEAVNRLASGDRLVIALRHFEGMSESDMAETLHCRAGTVKSRLSRAMARLRAELSVTEVPDA